jgi:hypothetical protein
VTVYQIAGIAAVLAVAAWQYIPWGKLPTVRRSVMKDIACVVAIREANAAPEIRKACNELLRVLLDTK